MNRVIPLIPATTDSACVRILQNRFDGSLGPGEYPVCDVTVGLHRAGACVICRGGEQPEWSGV